MCLAVLAIAARPGLPLLVAANRDEFYERPARAAGFWPENSSVLGGRDLSGGGTWFGLDRSGRYALLTNYRDPREKKPDAPSRGLLLKEFLFGAAEPREFLSGLVDRAGLYNGFNLILGDRRESWWFSNRTRETRALGPGVHAVSNALLDTPWPKVRRTKARVEKLLQNGSLNEEAAFQILADAEPAPDADLPDTGVGLEWERTLSSPFITSPIYGTRASTVAWIDASGSVTFVERTFDPVTKVASDVRFEFNLEP